MKRFTFPLLCFVFAVSTLSARSQVVPAATSSGFRLSAGGLGSAFQPDFADTTSAETAPNRIYGFGAYVDMKFTRWVQLEGEAHWVKINQKSYNTYPPLYNGEATYQIGPRIPIHTFGRWTPYGKVLWGVASAPFLTGNATALTFGGGVDYRISHRFTLRAFDFEYQDWNVASLQPYGGSVGLSYRIF